MPFRCSQFPLKHAALVILSTTIAITSNNSARSTRGCGPLAESYSPRPYSSHRCVRNCVSHQFGDGLLPGTRYAQVQPHRYESEFTAAQRIFPETSLISFRRRSSTCPKFVMALLDPELAPMEAQGAAEVVEQFPHIDHRADDPAPAYTPDEKHIQEKTEVLEKAGSLSSGTVDDNEVDADDKLHDERGREKVLETAEDFSRALVSSDDDPTLTINTFRMWFTGIGLAVFGAVLGMLFVSASLHNLMIMH